MRAFARKREGTNRGHILFPWDLGHEFPQPFAGEGAPGIANVLPRAHALAAINELVRTTIVQGEHAVGLGHELHKPRKPQRVENHVAVPCKDDVVVELGCRFQH